MQQERKVITIIKKDSTTGKRADRNTAALPNDWQTWTPQQRADAMQRECSRFDHLKRYGRYSY